MTVPAIADTIRVIDSKVSLPLANGTALTGSLEYFPGPKALAIFGEDDLGPKQLTVMSTEAPAEHIALADDEVLICNWTDMRGVADALVSQGIVELTGKEVAVGIFRLQAFVARVL